jgi:hypothetical protein
MVMPRISKFYNTAQNILFSGLKGQSTDMKSRFPLNAGTLKVMVRRAIILVP